MDLIWFRSFCSGYTFADAGNLEHCAKYLNQTLMTFGFPASLDLFAADPESIARTCNFIHSLLQQKQRDIEFRESANDQRQRNTGSNLLCSSFHINISIEN
ncbi:uncharacterized protein LOC109840079 isoform X4 [Asparagus officinalis]|uniref:uncharacterized protein LOC109840079 isoform X4 n=1 Tax=Asparagus officinalis TaxID=4686 RepID=UPI00098E231B|nr:uncharacterized protein LOC109840079 isoform X4 [Asparagus officinalis]